MVDNKDFQTIYKFIKPEKNIDDEKLKEYKWNLQKLENNYKLGKFFHINQKDELSSVRIITGMKRMLNNNQNVIYLPNVSLTGLKDNIENYMKKVGYSNSQIKEIFSNSINFNNYETILKEHYSSFFNEKKPVKNELEEKIIKFIDNIDRVKVVDKNYRLCLDKNLNIPNKKSLNFALRKRYNKLSDDKVLDVSHIDNETFMGTKIKNKPTKLKGKFYHEDLKLISNNLENYLTVFNLIFDSIEKQKFSYVLDYINELNVEKPKETKVTKTKTKLNIKSPIIE